MKLSNRVWQSGISLIACVSLMAYAGGNTNPTGSKCGSQQSPIPENQQGALGDGSKKSSDPIYLATGDFQHSQQDLYIPGRGLDFQLTRMYRSRSSLFADITQDPYFDPTPVVTEIGSRTISNRSPLGIGWQLNYNMRIDLSQDGGVSIGTSSTPSPDPQPVILADNEPDKIMFYDGSGRWDQFDMYTTHDAIAGDPALYSNEKIPILFQYSVHNAFITMLDENQVRYRFLPFYSDEDESLILPYAGRLHSITDTNGNEMTFSYETSNGVERLASMVDSLGHTINFFYHDDPGSSLGATHPADHVAHLLWRVIDHAGRTVEYDYENISADYEARLISATLPSIENTADFPLQYTSLGGAVDHARFPSGRKWQYNYAPTLPAGEWLRDGMISEIIDPNGVTIIQNEYDLDGYSERTYGRVIRQQYGDESYNYVFIDETNELDFPDTNKEYYVWVNDRRGAVIRYKYAKAASPTFYVPSEMQLLEKTEFLDFVDDPDLRVFAESANGGLGDWKQISSTGVISPLTGTIPSLANSVTTSFAPSEGWNTGSVTYPSGLVSESTFLNQDFPPPAGEYANPQLSRTETSRTLRSDDNSIVITENWLYGFGFGGGGCGCGSSDHYTAYRDGNGNVTRKVYDDSVDPVTQRPNGNLLAVYQGLPASYFNSNVLDQNAAAFDAVSVNEFTYNEWGQLLTHRHPGKWIINSQGNEELHRRLDSYDYYGDSNDEANYGRLKTKRVDVNGLNLATHYEYDLIGNVIKITTPRGYVSKFLYNQDSELVRLQRLDDANNLFDEKIFFYDANGNLVAEEVLNLDGDQTVGANKWFTTVHVYDKLGYRTETSGENGHVVGVFSSYNATTNQANSQATNLNYISNRWTYDGNRNLIKFEDAEAVNGSQASNIVTHTYDARDQKVETVAGIGSGNILKTAFEYDENRRLVNKIVNPDDLSNRQVTSYAYDWFNRVVSVNDPMGNEFLYGYDNNHNVNSIIACGPIGEDAIDGDTLYTLAKTSKLYDALNRPYNKTVESFQYDYIATPPAGEACELVPSSSTQFVTNTVYNSDSSVRSVSIPSGQIGTTTKGYFYDTASRLSFTEDDLGNTVQSFYDADSNVISILSTDESTLDSSFEQFEVNYEYHDGLNRRTAVIDGVGNRTEFKYDSRSNLVECKDARGNIDTYTYDSLSRQVGTSIGNGTVTTSSEYDASSRLIKETDANGNETDYEYDGLNRLAKIIMPDGEFYEAQYDANGNMSQYTDARGVIVSQSFDLNNRLVGRSISGTSIPGTTTESFTYDGMGRLRTAQNDFSKITREYDSRSNVVRELQNIDAANSFPVSSDRVVTYEFDLANNNTKLSYPGGREIYRKFDELNRLAGVFNDQAMTADPISEFEYIGYRLLQRNHGNGTQTAYTYNGIENGSGGVTNMPGDFGFGRVATIATTKVSSSTTLDSFEFVWDENQNRIQYNDLGSGMKNRRERTFGYDAANRLISTDVDFPDPLTDFPTPTNNGVTNYTLDGVYNRTDVSGFEGSGAAMGTYSQSGDQAKNNQYSVTPRLAGGEWMNVYDGNGNLIQKYQLTIADFNGDYAVNFYDVSAFLAAFNSQDPSADMNGDGIYNFYDVSTFTGAHGAIGDGTQLEQWYYSYDFRNQMIEAKQYFGPPAISGHLAHSTMSAYDSLARRVQESVDIDGDGTDDSSRQLVYGCASHWEVIEQIDLADDSTLMTHVYGLGIDDEISYQYEDQGAPRDLWTHRDDLNSLTSVTDDQGVVLERYEYGDYGRVTIFDASGLALPASAINAQHLYTGRSLITGTGLYDYRHRVMESETGRFIQRDPLGYVDSMNVYAYVSMNPMVLMDPLGLSHRRYDPNYEMPGNFPDLLWAPGFDPTKPFVVANCNGIEYVTNVSDGSEPAETPPPAKPVKKQKKKWWQRAPYNVTGPGTSDWSYLTCMTACDQVFGKGKIGLQGPRPPENLLPCYSQCATNHLDPGKIKKWFDVAFNSP